MGRFVEVDGNKWHPEHFACRICSRPIADGPYLYENGNQICKVDYLEHIGEVNPSEVRWVLEDHGICAICDSTLVVFAEDHWENRFCVHHLSEYENCFSCGRLVCDDITGGGRRYEDGRMVCNSCLGGAVSNPVVASRVLEEVLAFFSEMNLSLDVEIPLKLVSNDDIQVFRRDSHSNVVGVCICAAQAQRRFIEAIVILDGLPKEYLAMVLAHELCHGWLFLNRFPRLDPHVEEGICELIGFLWLRSRPTPEAYFQLRLMNRSDPVYGQGLKRARQCVEDLGLIAVLDHVKVHGTFPY